jgi:hypothetical protein
MKIELTDEMEANAWAAIHSDWYPGAAKTKNFVTRGSFSRDKIRECYRDLFNAVNIEFKIFSRNKQLINNEIIELVCFFRLNRGHTNF